MAGRIENPRRRGEERGDEARTYAGEKSSVPDKIADVEASGSGGVLGRSVDWYRCFGALELGGRSSALQLFRPVAALAGEPVIATRRRRRDGLAAPALLAGGGACGYGDLDIFRYGRYTAGLSGALFGRGSACGGCYELRCVNNILYCLRGSPTVVVTATDFCAPNFGLADDYGGWCNFPKEHLEMTEAAFLRVAKAKADIVQVQFRRVSCDRAGGIRFTITGGPNFLQVLITNVAADGEVDAVKVKGSKTGWIPMGRNWGQNWQCDADLRGQPLSFEVTGGKGRTITIRWIEIQRLVCILILLPQPACLCPEASF
ncbi:unnamed protein product [Triticum turgidum subsp. durum]|uniref:Expansin n=1 Tax=Triticum turgidum subsp. durum TaxID=4567 RepID=A0A9R1BRK7_TRITD|nr:unnamed protein product [Triticum turgidum subsp. durum]